FRGRAGLAVDNTLVYFTGGLALGHLKSSSTKTFACCGGFSDFGSLNTTQVGWVAGLGVEHKFTPNWSGVAEFRFYDLGHKSATAHDAFGTSYSTEFSHEIFTATVGVNYRW